jgi:hypothetical protein
MAKMPVDSRLRVEKAIEDGLIVQGLRPYLGISSIADPCARKLWYSFRLCSQEEITPRQTRLFQRGHNEEPIIQADLRRIGIIHHSEQLEVTHGNGHILGHIDDLLDNVPDAPKTQHLGEYKTHNDKSFKSLLKSGMKGSKPLHYGQMICYMEKLKLKRGLYIAVNKNDDSRYYERISEDPAKAQFYLSRGVDIISSEVPPPMMAKAGPNWFECKWCSHYEVCHYGQTPIKTCRSCKYCDILDNGKWECSGHKIELSFAQQQLACKNYKLMKALEG